MLSRIKIVSVVISLGLLNTPPSWALTEANYYQSSELKAPEKGSVAGSLSAESLQTDQLAQGAFSVPISLEIPTERGKPLHSFIPTYSPGAGLSEWGTGVSTQLTIKRHQRNRDIDYQNDELSSPWGELVKGSDGFWYPIGFEKRVRVNWKSDQSIEAYLDDGTTLVFDLPLEGSHGTYAWYIRHGFDLQGNRTEFEYENFGTDSYPVLKKVFYGSKRFYPGYQIEFEYEPIEFPWFDYRSGKKYFLNRQLKKMVVSSRNSLDSSFSELWSYDFKYHQDPGGPRFYLTQFQRTFASGNKEPAYTFDYEYPRHAYEDVQWKVLPEYDEVAKKYGQTFYYPTRGSFLDLDQDGIPMIEVNENFTRIKKRGDEVGVEHPQMAPLNSSFAACQFHPVGKGPSARRFTRFFGPQDELRAIVSVKKDADTRVVLCDINGGITHEGIIEGNWSLGGETQLADLNHNGKPDLVRILGGTKVTILENVSTPETGIHFVKRNTFTAKSVSGKAHSVWVQDLNGDGIADIIMLYSTGLFVFWGKGNFEFEQEPEYLGLWHAPSKTQTKMGTSGDYTFVDFNQDGIADLIINTHRSSYFFLNQVHHPAKKERMLQVPFRYMIDKTWNAPTFPQILDLTGSGNPQMVMGLNRQIYVAELASPGTGLMKSVSDGKGNQSIFEYMRAPAEPGIKSRTSVLKRIEYHSAGMPKLSYEFNFKGVKTFPTNKRFAGFEKAEVILKDTRDEPVLLKQLKYLIGEFAPGLLQEKLEIDYRAPDLRRFKNTDYEEKLLYGISHFVPKKVESGFLSSTGTKVSNETMFEYDSNHCPVNISERKSHGVLATQKIRFQNDILSSFPHCLEQEVWEVGTHSDAQLNFTHALKIERNEIGLPVSIVGLLPEPKILQSLEYDSFWNVRRATSLKEGVTYFDYENDQLNSILQESGLKIQVSQRDPISDTILQLDTDLGGGLYRQFFQYDDWRRLTALWDSRSGGSAAFPLTRYHYQFASEESLGKIMTETRVNQPNQTGYYPSIELFSGSGQKVGHAIAAPQPSQVILKEVEIANPNLGLTETYRLEGKTFDWSKNWQVGELLNSSSLLGSVTQTHFGSDLNRLTTVQSDLRNQKESIYSIHTNGINQAVVENQSTVQNFLKSLDEKLLSFTDESGRITSFTYDALGRLRKIHLPGSSEHKIAYDPQGNVAQIDRTGVGSIRYHYSARNLLQSKVYKDTQGKTIQNQEMQYDSAGRVIQKINRLESPSEGQKQGAESTYSYAYDGNPINSSSTDRHEKILGQAGQLTHVLGPEFKKSWIYLENGKLERSEYQMGSKLKLENQLSYRTDGLLGQKKTTINGLDGRENQAIQINLDYAYDSNGRTKTVQLNGSPLYEITYDMNSNIQSIALQKDREIVELRRDEKTQRTKAIHRKKAEQKFEFEWLLNPRGLVASEKFSSSPHSQVGRKYDYTLEGFLKSDSVSEYEYDEAGLMKLEKNSSIEVIQKDAFGRVNVKGKKKLIYGPSGRVEQIKEGDSLIAEYVYDENAVRIIKKKEGRIVEAYVDDAVITPRSYMQPVEVSGFVLGVIQVHEGSTEFKSLISDSRGSIVQDKNGNLHVASSYGVKSAERGEESVAIDYGKIAYDPDLDAYRAQYRDYDPRRGQFLTADPLFLESPEECTKSPIECNLYGYAAGNPISFVDRTGLFVDSAGKEFAGPAPQNMIEARQYDSMASFHAFDANGRDAKGIIPDHKIETAISIATGAGALKELATSAFKAESKVILGEASQAVSSFAKASVETEKAIACKITGYTKHGLNQAISRNEGRGVSISGILDAVRNPEKIVNQANGAIKYVGERATVILNEAGKIITTFGKPRGQ